MIGLSSTIDPTGTSGCRASIAYTPSVPSLSATRLTGRPVSACSRSTWAAMRSPRAGRGRGPAARPGGGTCGAIAGPGMARNEDAAEQQDDPNPWISSTGDWLEAADAAEAAGD